MPLPRLALAVLIALAATPALAHTGHGDTEAFTSGLAHPLFGLDHLLAMVAVGLWAGLIGGSALWAWPAAFVGVMAVGGALGMAGVALPGVEPLIVGSVIAIGLLTALAARPAVALGAAVCGVFALAHGHAHGTEMPAAASAAGYALGFVISTAFLHGVGIAIARVGEARPLAVRAAGGAVACLGVALVAGVL